MWVVVVCDELIDQLRHAYAPLDRRIVLEGQLRRALEAELGRDLALENAVRRVEPLERACAFLLGPEDAHVDGRLPQVRRGLDARDRHEADARILQAADGIG